MALTDYQKLIQGNINRGEEVEIEFNAYRNILTLISNDEVNYCILLLDQYRPNPITVLGTIPSYLTITHTQYATKIKIKNNSSSYMIHYNFN